MNARRTQNRQTVVADMAHRLRTPLNAILIFSQQLTSNADGNLTNQQVDYSRIIHSSGQDLLRAIDETVATETERPAPSIAQSSSSPADPIDVQAGHVKVAERDRVPPSRILIVDDEPNNLLVLETVLANPEYELVRAQSAKQALLALDIEQFALVILDVRLPDIGGFELARMIKRTASNAHVPIIFLTAYFYDDEHVVEGYETGAVDYLQKPVNPSILRSKVAVFIELHRTQNELAKANRSLADEVTDHRSVQNQLCAMNASLELHIAERTRALRTSEERLRLAIVAANMGLWDWNVATGAIVWTPEHERLFGYPTGNPDRTYSDFRNRIHPDDIDRVEAALRLAIDQRGAYHCEHRVVWPDGSVHWISSSGSFVHESDQRPVRMLGMIVDVTARKRRERNLTFLGDLQKSLVPWSSTDDIMIDATRRIADHLSVGHCAIVEIDETSGACVVLRDHNVLGLASLEGRYRIDEFHSEQERRLLRAGGTLVVNDVKSGSRTSARVEQFEGAGVGSLVNAAYVVDGRWKFVLHVSHKSRFDWPQEDVELITELAARVYAWIERARSEAALKSSQQRLRAIFDGTFEYMGLLTPDGVLREANRALLNFAGSAREDVIGRPFWDSVWFATTPGAPEQMRRTVERVAQGEAVRFETNISTPSGESRTFDMSFSPVFNEEGQVDFIVPAALDITDRRRVEVDNKLLMAEVNHRAKNLLAVVQAVAHMTSRNSDPAHFVERLSERMSGISANQDLLIKNDWQAIPLRDLITAQFDQFTDDWSTRISLEGPTVRVKPSVAQGLGMAIHELYAHSSKKGALSNDSGQIVISWRIARANDPDFVMSWIEAGGPNARSPLESFAKLVVVQMVESTVDGTVELVHRDEGLCWTLQAKVAKIIEGGRFGVLDANAGHHAIT